MTGEATRASVGVERTLVLRLTGTLDASTIAETLAHLHDSTAAVSPPAALVLDLRDVRTLSARAARELIKFVTAYSPHVRLLIDPDSVAVRALRLIDPAGTVPAFTDPAQALKPFGPPSPAETEADVPWLTEFESLARTLLGDTTVAGALRHVVEAAQRVIEGADLVSITLRAHDGGFSTPAATAPVGAVLDQVQYRSGDGPCVSAAQPEGPGYVHSDDLRDEARWPSFTAASAGHGFRAIISTALQPIEASESLSGALNVYSRKPHGLTAADRHAALLLATHASLALAHAQTAELAELERAQLRQAVSSRDVIGQAKGILMNRQGITADEAFDLLRRTSQDLNVKLVDLARTLATRHTDLDESR
ncbi:ANTAR domain-containing protein [Amycolatopsis sp. NPDC098790]|uniref:ANTAR domain-containing protein n=1 Tax=Amycolatopsis sp. NPDC098790 TaxID=3363939 RepID=UPI00380AB186